MASDYVKKTITLPAELAERLKASTRNLSAFVAAACAEKLLAEERKALERDMVERCRVRYGEDQRLAEEFFEAEQEVWDSVP